MAKQILRFSVIEKGIHLIFIGVIWMSSKSWAQSRIQCNSQDGLYTTNFDTCRTYVWCQNSIAGTEMTCPNGEIFYQDIQSCVSSDSYDCGRSFQCDGSYSNHVDPNSCDRYYSCDGRDYGLRRSCPSGQVFNPNSRFCQNTNQVDPSFSCGGQNFGRLYSCSSSDGNFIDTSDSTCTYYYSCSRNVATRQQCPLNQRFQPILQRCVSADSVDCNDPNPFTCSSANEDYPDPRNCSRFYSCQSYAPLHRSCERNKIFMANLKRCEYGDVNSCSSNSNPSYTCPQYDGNIPDPNDPTCKSYYSCSNYQGTKQTCQSGFSFHPHPNMRKCVLEDSVDCNMGQFNCPSANVDVVDPNNCNRFYSCQNSVPLHRTCPSGQIFKNGARRCENGDDSSQCTSRPSPQQTCRDQQDGNYPNLSDNSCTTYLVCRGGGVSSTQTCPSGFRFHPHPNMRRCLLADSVDCNDPAPPFVCPGTNIDTVDPRTCARFYSCQNSVPLHRTCASGQVFSNYYRRCVLGNVNSCPQ